jgi:hypothetical protein
MATVAASKIEMALIVKSDYEDLLRPKFKLPLIGGMASVLNPRVS